MTHPFGPMNPPPKPQPSLVRSATPLLLAGHFFLHSDCSVEFWLKIGGKQLLMRSQLGREGAYTLVLCPNQSFPIKKNVYPCRQFGISEYSKYYGPEYIPLVGIWFVGPGLLASWRYRCGKHTHAQLHKPTHLMAKTHRCACTRA